MGVSTDGIIFCGWPLEEDVELPWGACDEDGEYDEGDHEEWWRRISGFENLFQLYNERGEYVGGVRPDDEKIGAYYEHRRKWLEANPIPFEVVNYCSGDYPIYAIALNGTVTTARRGFPQKFDPEEMEIDLEEADRIRLLFLEHGMHLPDDDPAWHLASYWG